MKSRVSFWSFIALFCSAAGALAAPVAYTVRDYGAVGDGVSKDTAAVQAALDACAVGGGGEVRVPAGTYLIGSVQLGARTTLVLEPDSVLLGSPDAADYPTIDVRWEGRWQPGRRALIHAADVDDIAITGAGRIVGNAEMAAPQNPRGAVVLEAMHCRRVRWEGVSVEQGGNWATHPTLCEDVTIRGLTIRGGRDGIDIDSCRNVLIEHCDIDTGDDSISLKSGRGLDGARLGKPTEHVVIRDCRLVGRRFAAIGIGSEISGGVRDVQIQRCELAARTHAIYLKTRLGRAGVTEDIHGEDLTVTGGGFLRINLTRGGNTNTADDPVPGEAGWPSARNLSFERVDLRDVRTVVDATEIALDRPLTGLRLHDIHGTALAGMRLQHVRDLDLAGIALEGVTGPWLQTRDVTGTGAGLAEATPFTDRIDLFNGRDLAGWVIIPDERGTMPPAQAITIADGVVSCRAEARGYLRTEQSYANYHLHVEWRWPAGAKPSTNSGVLVHETTDKIWPASYQVQMKTADSGDLLGMDYVLPGAPMIKDHTVLVKQAAPAERPAGEWNTFEIECRDDVLTVELNGVKQNAVAGLDHRAGRIALMLEGHPVDFRNVWIERH